MINTPKVVVEVSNHKIMKVVTDQMDTFVALIDNDEGDITVLGTCFNPDYCKETFEMCHMIQESRHCK